MLAKILKSSVYRNRVLGIIFNDIREGKLDSNLCYEPLFGTRLASSDLKQVLLQGPMTESPLAPVVNSVVDSEINQSIKFSNENGKKLVFCSSPSLSLMNQRQAEHIKHYFDDKGVTYLNFARQQVLKADPQYWVDASHLADEGAQLFIDQLHIALCDVLSISKSKWAKVNCYPALLRISGI